MIIVIEALQCNSNVMHYFAMQLPPVLTHGPLLRRASTTYHIVLVQSKPPSPDPRTIVTAS
jgi:hypothetical protein